MELPKKLIESVVEENTQVGNVIKYYSFDFNIALQKKVLIKKEKCMVIISKCVYEVRYGDGSSWPEEYYGCIYINAHNYPDISGDKILKSQQLVASVKKYKSFLKKDSFFDCSTLTAQDVDRIKGIVKKSPGRVLGKIDEDDLDAIRKVLRNSITIPPKQKKLFGLV
jgi:hypothetical protein